MDVTARTGHTKAARDTHLVALPMSSVHGEQVWLAVDVHAKAADAKTVERECAQVIERSLLETDGEPHKRFDSTLKELNGLLKGLLVGSDIRDVHMLLALLAPDGNLFVSHAGRAEAYLIRRGTASQITEYSGGKPVPSFVHVASGRVEPRDIVILSTTRLLRSLTPAQLSQLSQRAEDPVDHLVRALEREEEQAAFAVITIAGAPASSEEAPAAVSSSRARRGVRRAQAESVLARGQSMLAAGGQGLTAGLKWLLPKLLKLRGVLGLKDVFARFIADLTHPKRKRRAHLLLIASALAALLVIWVIVHLFTSSQRSKTRGELEELVEQINTEVQTAENRRLIGDADAANAILDRAEERAKQVMDNETGLFRVEALDLLDRIRSKKEEINNIVRLSPRVLANVSAKNPDVAAQGLMGLSDGEFLVYDKQDIYRVLQNAVDDAIRLSDSELIVDATNFDRFQSQVYLTTNNGVLETINGQNIQMKTDDPAGWVAAKDIKGYLRYLYALVPDQKQIYKYERLSNRYGPPVPYNVNGDLTGAIDMAIDGNVYVLKDDGTFIKLLRGEVKPFVIRQAPEALLQNTTKVYKTERYFYFLDPVGRRVIVATDGGDTGESTYLKQYVLEGEQMTVLQDLFVDPEDAHLYVLDEKRVYAIDLGTK